ncbi:hypothetical protein GIB67_038780 [Kingdonia uniflora]|uniref:WRKY domain-containing protein n=1 Tax=Kingdonia uniflora TaxID=39325 RepID=A0A7J7M0N2_9MAGN|nr:hypothetical protein GIB67_038780 [Kingdonia uniflora]
MEKNCPFVFSSLSSSISRKVSDDVNGDNPTWSLGILKTDGIVPSLDITSTTSESNIGGSGNDKVKSGDKKKVRKQRYAFQTRSHVDILDDGYRWRKYGQKAVKNNKYPRSYYRCTHQGCSVKKQVQRLCKDEEVVVTTYEGMHVHDIEKSTDNFEHILSQMKIYNF